MLRDAVGRRQRGQALDPDVARPASTSRAVGDLGPTVVAYVVSQLQGYFLLASPVHVKGVAYEEGGCMTTAMNYALHRIETEERSQWSDPARGRYGLRPTAPN
jgi:hypothetical protein